MANMWIDNPYLEHLTFSFPIIPECPYIVVSVFRRIPRPVSISLFVSALSVAGCLNEYWFAYFVETLTWFFIHITWLRTFTTANRIRIDWVVSYFADFYPRSIFQLPSHVRFSSRVSIIYFCRTCSLNSCSSPILHGSPF